MLTKAKTLNFVPVNKHNLKVFLGGDAVQVWYILIVRYHGRIKINLRFYLLSGKRFCEE